MTTPEAIVFWVIGCVILSIGGGAAGFLQSKQDNREALSVIFWWPIALPLLSLLCVIQVLVKVWRS
jgi:hypothetical protein